MSKERNVEINELIHREGVERLREAGAKCAASRISHRGLADGYRKRIDALRAVNVADWQSRGAMALAIV
jgi:hypothetical protein